MNEYLLLTLKIVAAALNGEVVILSITYLASENSNMRTTQLDFSGAPLPQPYSINDTLSTFG